MSHSSLKFGHLELRVSNPLMSSSFYVKTLGFELVANQENQFIWLKSGDLEILLRPSESNIQDIPFFRSPFNLVLYTNDFSQSISKLKAAGINFQGEDAGCPLFQDPDGHWFQIVDANHQ